MFSDRYASNSVFHKRPNKQLQKRVFVTVQIPNGPGRVSGHGGVTGVWRGSRLHETLQGADQNLLGLLRARHYLHENSQFQRQRFPFFVYH